MDDNYVSNRLDDVYVLQVSVDCFLYTSLHTLGVQELEPKTDKVNHLGRRSVSNRWSIRFISLGLLLIGPLLHVFLFLLLLFSCVCVCVGVCVCVCV